MRVLAVSDIHGANATARRIAESLAGVKVDAIIVAGDVTNFGDEKSFTTTLQIFDAPGPQLFYIPGNCDLVQRVRSGRWVSIHGEVREFGGFDFLGVGGSNPSPFGTPFELEEAELESILTSSARVRSESKRPLVLVSHPPPWGTRVDVTFSGRHVGSMAVRRFVESHQPTLVVCGHIHEGRGIDRIGRTTIVNVAAAREGYYAVMSLNDSVGVKLYRLGAEVSL